MRRLGILLFVVLGIAAAPLSADTIVLNSGAGLAWEALVNLPGALDGATGTTTTIAPHAAWAPNGEGLWVSYAKTGISPDSVVVPYYGQTPVLSVFQEFSFASGTGFLDLRVWADDTAFVYLNGAPLFASHVWGQSTCETQPISCAAANFGDMEAVLAPGDYTLRFDLFQVGTGTTNDSNPFGGKWEGAVEVVPEPGSMLLLGTGLLGLAGAIRRRTRK